MKPKDIKHKTMWAYFCPDGYLQVRSIGFTKKEAKENISYNEPMIGYKYYEKKGFSLEQIVLDVRVNRVKIK